MKDECQEVDISSLRNQIFPVFSDEEMAELELGKKLKKKKKLKKN